jgi:hypothetical protein
VRQCRLSIIFTARCQGRVVFARGGSQISTLPLTSKSSNWQKHPSGPDNYSFNQWFLKNSTSIWKVDFLDKNAGIFEDMFGHEFP